MYHVSTQGVDERMINVHYYYYSMMLSHLVLVVWAPDNTAYAACLSEQYDAL